MPSQNKQKICFIVSGSDFDGETMNTVDMILSQIGQPTDGLGSNWSPLERVVHKFHMKDLWAKIKTQYDLIEEVCRLKCVIHVIYRCLLSKRDTHTFLTSIARGGIIAKLHSERRTCQILKQQGSCPLSGLERHPILCG